MYVLRRKPTYAGKSGEDAELSEALEFLDKDRAEFYLALLGSEDSRNLEIVDQQLAAELDRAELERKIRDT